MQAPKTTYQYAKFYQSKGLVPLPLVPKGKFPSVEGWQQRNLNSEITAKAFAAKNNIGILCGEVSGIFVLDIDNKDRGVEIYNRLLLERGIAENDLTLVATTGSGGKHLFFKYNPQYGTSTGVIKFGGEPVGWDIRSNGGQVVVEPSEHPETKRQYKFEGDLETIVGRIQYLPMWLEDILDCGGVVDFEGRLVADYERAIEEENRRAQAPVERRAEYPPMAPNALTRYLELLAPRRWNDYTMWVKIGMAVYNETNGSNEGRDLWKQHSEQHYAGYNAAQHDRKWRSFGRRNEGAVRYKINK